MKLIIFPSFKKVSTISFGISNLLILARIVASLIFFEGTIPKPIKSVLSSLAIYTATKVVMLPSLNLVKGTFSFLMQVSLSLNS